MGRQTVVHSSSGIPLGSKNEQTLVTRHDLKNIMLGETN